MANTLGTLFIIELHRISLICFRLDFMARNGLLMFTFGGGLVVAFMETINSAINSKDTKTERVSV